MANEKRVARRRSRKPSASADDFISELKSGNVQLGKKAQQLAESKQVAQDHQPPEWHDDPLFSDKYTYDNIIVQRVMPSADNPRFLPVAQTEGDQEKIDAAQDCVVCDKGILENRLSPEHPRFEEINDEIEEIKGLAATIKTQGLIQPITVWRKNTSSYPIIAGHRRYYAIIYLYGALISVRCKIYLANPQRIHSMRFVENNARRDTSVADNLASYEMALSEISAELKKCETKAQRIELVQNSLGISRMSQYRLDKLLDHKDILKPLLSGKNAVSIKVLYKEISGIEKKHPEQVSLRLTEWVNSVMNGETLVSETKVEEEPTPEVQKPKPVAKRAGRSRKFYTMPKLPVNKPEALKPLIEGGLSSIDCGVSWSELDYSDVEAVQEALNLAIESLTKQ